MNRTDRALILAALAALVVAALAGGPVSPPLPQCHEDQALVGAGDYEAGRWTAYECGPALDDLGTVR